MIAVDVASPFLAPFKLVILLAVAITFPISIYNFWAFIAPGLYSKEKKFLAASSTFDLHVHAALSIRILLICMSSPRRVLFHRFAGHSMCRAAKF